ncbi:kinesin-4-like [Dorcoceras hygrometricum]|uniref:Kinesin-4-like n=1 Tax=Dorcoceras hygrometricum TaxID=472368 RepID=A0A2Z7A9D6_9LAMI|nr:kinesin-4-like [Dorcoceras hygrometricum]
MSKKEEQVLSWGETESPQVAIQRKSYILLKYRKVLIWKFLESWRSNFVPGPGSTAVALFFNSFSLKKLATINIDEMSKKEEQVLSWGETESPQVAIQRKSYILLKYRKVLIWKFLESWRSNFVPGQGSTAVDRRVIDLLSDRHVSILEELTTTERAHGLIWKKPCCSTVFEGSPRDRGAVIARTNTNTRSSCWIRTMILVDGVWTVEPCADKWVKIPRQVISHEVHRQRQYDDTLPTVSAFFRMTRKRWADVCLEVVGFCASRRLLPIGSLQFCRSSSVVEPVFHVASGQSPIFAFRVSQFCSIFVDFSVFNWFPSADISDFLSSIALERTAFRSVQRSFAQSAVPSVQVSLDQRPSSPTTADSSSSLHFDTSDVDATASSLPPVSPDFSAALADLQAILSEQINESQSGISSKLHKIEQGFRDSLSDQAALFKSLSQEARQEGRSMDDVQTMHFNEFRNTILAQNASIFVGLADVRKQVQEVNAKVDIMASRLNDVQKDAEATKEALSHQLFEFQIEIAKRQRLDKSKRQRLDKLERQCIDWLRQISRCFVQSISADSWFFDSLFISEDGYNELQPADDVNQQSKLFDIVDEVSAGYQSYFRRKLKLIQNTIVYSNEKDS